MLTIQISGQGNPDAVGDPKLPEMPWAMVRMPDRQVSLTSVDTSLEPRIEHLARLGRQLVATVDDRLAQHRIRHRPARIDGRLL